MQHIQHVANIIQSVLTRAHIGDRRTAPFASPGGWRTPIVPGTCNTAAQQALRGLETLRCARATSCPAALIASLFTMRSILSEMLSTQARSMTCAGMRAFLCASRLEDKKIRQNRASRSVDLAFPQVRDGSAFYVVRCEALDEVLVKVQSRYLKRVQERYLKRR